MDIEKIATIDNEVEAKLLTSILEERSIPHVVISYRDRVYNGIFQVQRGWGFVRAPKEKEQEILEILEDIRKT